jgi:hypothetical protein
MVKKRYTKRNSKSSKRRIKYSKRRYKSSKHRGKSSKRRGKTSKRKAMQGGVPGMEIAAAAGAAAALPLVSGTVFNKIGDGFRSPNIKDVEGINQRRLERASNRPFQVKRDESNDGVIDCGEYDSSEDECSSAGGGNKCKWTTTELRGKPFNECLLKDYTYSTKPDYGKKISNRELQKIRGRQFKRNRVDKVNAELMGEGL